MKFNKVSKKSLVGFFPEFISMGETYPLIKIAKYLKKIGGTAIFFSHGGKYEYLANEIGCNIIRIEPLVEDGMVLTRYLVKHREEDLFQIIKDEVTEFKKTEIQALVHTNVFFDAIIASRVAKIPLISVVSGAWTPAFYQANRATFPDESESAITLLLPPFLKNRITNWYALHHTNPVTKKLNRIAKKMNIPLRLKSDSELVLGDYTLICDDIKFLEMQSTKEIPIENYIGPILPDNFLETETNQIDEDIKNHLKRPGKKILLTMGTSRQSWKDIFIRILHCLNQTNHNVIATYTSILHDDELPELKDNILLKKFVTDVSKIHQKIDLAIIHGGRGTVYTTAYAGKPAIGFPNHLEQQNNLNNLVRHGTTIQLSKKYFTERKLEKAIEKIFDNYDFYLKKAQSLVEKLPKPQGDKKAAEIIANIVGLKRGEK